MNSFLSPAQICCPTCRQWFVPNMQSVIIEAHLDDVVNTYIYCRKLCSMMKVGMIGKPTPATKDQPEQITLKVVRREKIQDLPEKWAIYCEKDMKRT